MMKLIKCVVLACIWPLAARAESGENAVRRIYFNLYTDSIKTILNYYVNVEGEYRNGRILPMDTGNIIITADHGSMSGNEWIAPARVTFEKVTFRATLKRNTAVSAEQTVWLKRLKDPRDDMDLPEVPDELRRRRK